MTSILVELPISIDSAGRISYSRPDPVAYNVVATIPIEWKETTVIVKIILDSRLPNQAPALQSHLTTSLKGKIIPSHPKAADLRYVRKSPAGVTEQDE